VTGDRQKRELISGRTGVSLISTPLGRYRIMSYVVGVMLLVIFAVLPFQIWGSGSVSKTASSIEAVIGPIHGVLYLIYLVTVIEVVVRYRVGLWMFVGMVVAGWCPFVAFIAEHYVTRRLTSSDEYRRWARQDMPAGSPPGQSQPESRRRSPRQQ
jgi:integral membrane protein